MQTINRPLTLAQALTQAPERWDEYGYKELTATDSEREAAATTWLWLQGLDGASDAGLLARQCIVGPRFDAPLLVALSAPATEFLSWFMAEDWECFDDGDDAWGWRVVDRACFGIEALGPLASQAPLRTAAT